jgi:thiol-disulfide isomerase/thioredoxin
VEQSSPEVVATYTDGIVELQQRIAAGQSLSGRERNCLYLNTGSPRFANVSAISGMDFADDGRGMAVSDWDFDGDPDLWISNRSGPRLRFLRNDSGSEGRFLAIRLSGNGSTCNRDAIGARLELRVAGVPLLRTLKAGEGYLSQSSKWLHFGLGSTGDIEALVVRWPDGTQREYEEGLEPNRFYSIRQGREIPEEWVPPTRSMRFSSSVIETPTSTQSMRLVLATRTPLPRLQYVDLEGRQRQVQELLQEPLLLNLWATWCAPCKEELMQLAQGNLRVLALSVDGLNEQSPTTHEDARRWLCGHGDGLLAGFANPALVRLLQVFHDAHFINRRPLPLPTSFLIDTDGTVSIIYKGMLSLEQLREDQSHLRDAAVRRRERASPFTGRWVRPIPELTPSELAARMAAEGLPEEAQAYLEELGSESPAGR